MLMDICASAFGCSILWGLITRPEATLMMIWWYRDRIMRQYLFTQQFIAAGL